MTDSGFQKRLEQIVAGRPINALAKKWGIPESLLRKYLKGESLPGFEKIESLVRLEKISPEWLLTGRGLMRRSPLFEQYLESIREAVEKGESDLFVAGDDGVEIRPGAEGFLDAREAAQRRVIEVLNRLERQGLLTGEEAQNRFLDKLAEELEAAGTGLPARTRSGGDGGRPHRADFPDNDVSGRIQRGVEVDLNDYAPIPRVDVMAAAGDAVLLPTEEIVDFLLFKKSWLRRELGIDPQRAVVVQAKGDSMKPSIRDGDLLLVEVLQESANDDGIYVINVGGRVMVKRLQFMLDRSIKIVSDNPAYEPQVIKGEQSEGFWIVGRVVWAGSRM